MMRVFKFITGMFSLAAMCAVISGPAMADPSAVKKSDLCDWTPEAVAQSFHLSHTNFEDDLDEGESVYTAQGNADYSAAIAESEFANRVLNGAYILSAKPLGHTRIGYVEDTKRWFLSFHLKMILTPAADENDDSDTAPSLSANIETADKLVFAEVREYPNYVDRGDFGIHTMAVFPLMSEDMGQYAGAPMALEDCD